MNFLPDFYATQPCRKDTYEGEELSLKDLLNIVEQYKELIDRMKKDSVPFPVRGFINVTGGEPFVRKDLMELLEVLSENRHQFSFGILCNGSFINEENAHKLHKLGINGIQVSIEGERETNDSIRSPGAFDAAVSAVKTIKKVDNVQKCSHGDNTTELILISK